MPNLPIECGIRFDTKSHLAGLLKNKEDLARFDAFLNWPATTKISEMSRSEQIAFYINAYNACCIRAVLDHYPVHSPKDIAGFFDALRIIEWDWTLNEKLDKKPQPSSAPAPSGK